MLKTQARIDNGQFRQIYDCEISAIRQAFDGEKRMVIKINILVSPLLLSKKIITHDFSSNIQIIEVVQETEDLRTAEAIPSIVHQADIAAFNERDLFYNNEASPTTSVDRHYGPLQNPSPNNCTYEILYVHDNLKNLPVLG
ncbi:unnamed protein product [Rotaria magnacalcarata]|uniref:Uncharacterized protein n=1 Tax=Rotaria magnacalcarata TaxID=392030 RepID=A0A819FIM4_9BILA|nr:unnamed protein product [Rotaria magnacalcarata]